MQWEEREKKESAKGCWKRRFMMLNRLFRWAAQRR
jgi:hypothetical protein